VHGGWTILPEHVRRLQHGEETHHGGDPERYRPTSSWSKYSRLSCLSMLAADEIPDVSLSTDT
jgi:hypothetical protein